MNMDTDWQFKAEHWEREAKQLISQNIHLKTQAIKDESYIDRLREKLLKLDGDSLDAMIEVVGEGPDFKRYNQGKSAMREWFLRRITAALNTDSDK